MTSLFYIPAIIRLLFIFLFILFLIRKKWSLGLSFLAGAITLSLFFGQTISATAISIVSSAQRPTTLTLSLMVILILLFSNTMETTGQMKRMLNSFKGLASSSGIKLVLFPALIGLLPMPGGAIFSAPMVKELGKDSNISKNKLSLINYWFRHIWEYWWPLYPGVLLAVALGNLNLFLFITYMLPLTIISVISGSISIYGMTSITSGERYKRESLLPFLKDVVPVLIVITGGPIIGYFISFSAPAFGKSIETGLIIALMVAICYVWFLNKISKKKLIALFLNTSIFKMVFMIFAILAFKQTLEDSQAVELITNEFIQLNVPVILITILLPFIVGLITGVTVAFVGISLPVLIPLIISSGDAGLIYPYTMLSIVCGFTGVLMSPLHLCFILSNEYFLTPMRSVYRYLIPLCMVLFVSGLTYFFISLKWFC